MPKKKDFILIGVLLVIALIGLGVTQFFSIRPEHPSPSQLAMRSTALIPWISPVPLRSMTLKATTKWSLRMAASTWRMPIVRINTVSARSHSCQP